MNTSTRLNGQTENNRSYELGSLRFNLQAPRGSGRFSPYIYLAGTRSECGWREKLTGASPVSERDALDADYGQICRGSFGSFVRIGPYFAPRANDRAPSPRRALGYSYSAPAGETQGDFIRGLNVCRHVRSDATFAVLDSPNCCETTAEIANGASSRRPLGLLYASNLTLGQRERLRFVERYATWVWAGATLEEAFSEFLSELSNWSWQASRRVQP